MDRVQIILSRLHCMDGVANQIASLMHGLRLQNWEPHLLVGMIDCPEESQPTLARLRNFAETFSIDPVVRVDSRLTPRMVLAQSRVIGQACKKHGVSIVHLRGRALSPAMKICSVVHGIRYLNAPPLATKPIRRLHQRILDWGFGRILGDRVIAISRQMEGVIINDWGVPKDRVRYVPHGVDLERFRSPTDSESVDARSRLGLKLDDFVVAQIARVAPIKRPDTVVHAAAKIVRSGRNCCVLLAGHYTSEEYSRVTQLSRDLGIADRVVLAGHCDTRVALWASDAFVLASEREGFGIAVVEAMATGLVPLRTPTEGANDQIDDGINGFLFPIGDFDCLAGRILFLIDHPSIRKEMARAARLKAFEAFGEAAMAAGTISVYNELVSL